MTGLIIFLAVFLGIIAIAVIAVLVIKHKLNNLTRSYLGKSVGETAKMLSDGFKNECMLPYSVPKLTPLYKPKIERDFPEMSYEQMESMAKNGIADILNAIESGHPENVANSSIRLQNQIRGIAEDSRSKNEVVHYDDIKIHSAGVESYSSSSEAASAVFQVALQSYSYVTQDGKITAGFNDKPTQNLFSVTLAHNQDLSETNIESYIEANCPNCGAPVPASGTRECPYCGTGLVAVVDRIWQIDSFKLLK